MSVEPSDTTVPQAPAAPPYQQPSQAPSVGQQYASPYSGYGQAPQQGYSQQPHVYQQPQTYVQPQFRQKTIGESAGTSGMVMGIIGTCMTILFGWIPFLGLFGVAVGIALGVPAIVQGRKANANRANGTPGIALGWVSVGVSMLWVAVYLVFLVGYGATYHGTTPTPSAPGTI